jgi:hypothetical protein
VVRERIAGIGGSRDRLESCFARLSAALSVLDQVREAIPIAEEAVCDAEAVEQRFAAEYTTETEREVLRAALSGGPLPAVPTGFGGNGVELF